MGNQGHSWDDGRRAVEWIQAGAIGDVREVHVWTNRPLAYWPQGVPRPQPQRISTQLGWNMPGVMARLANSMGLYSVPDTLSWDLFLGPSPSVEYHPRLSPVQLARLGRLGRRRDRRHGRTPDRSRLLGARPWLADEHRDPVDAVQRPCFPWATTTFYEFPARGAKPRGEDDVVRRRAAAAEAGGDRRREAQRDGRRAADRLKGKLIYDTYGLNPRLLPKSLNDSVGPPTQNLPRITTSHEINWGDACKGKGEASTPFDYAAG